MRFHHKWLCILAWLTLQSHAATAKYSMELAAVKDLGNLIQVPGVYDATGNSSEEIRPGDFKTIYFDGLDYEGKATRVFAWVGVPSEASRANPVPAVVLVHGGGGTAYKAWVEKWTARGYAAISIAWAGQTDEKGLGKQKWARHAWAGPGQNGGYGDWKQPIQNQWMYHAVADTILANSLMRSLSYVDAESVGVVGISGGGVGVSTVIGIDKRFAFGIPIYGCGDLANQSNYFGKILRKNELYEAVWDPMVHLNYATMPTLWLSWPKDAHFALDSQAACYGAVSGAHMVSLITGMGHGHPSGWNPLESYVFADNIVKDGSPWCIQVSVQSGDGVAKVTFDSTKRLDTAHLIHTSDTGYTRGREWIEVEANLKDSGNGRYVVSVDIPKGTTGWYVNVMSDGVVASSDYQEK